MRPDPYKLARSRQYKAKHGINSNKTTSSHIPSLPANISEDYFYKIAEDDTVDLGTNVTN
jgi:hypothetical protein